MSTYTISAPGSYDLTNNFTVVNGNGIVIAADGVWSEAGHGILADNPVSVI